MVPSPPCPVPEMLAVYCRDDEHMGRLEASIIYRNIRGDGSWQAMLMTDESFNHLSSSGFLNPMSHADWRPVDWRWDPNAFMFCPPNLEWDIKAQTWVNLDADDIEVSKLPAKNMLPKPQQGEHHSTWRSRCRRQFPALESDEGTALLGEVWNDFKAGD